ncbi:reverse transcriptase domain-containing protein, partial [Aciditerrimonas ferrireducens]
MLKVKEEIPKEEDKAEDTSTVQVEKPDEQPQTEEEPQEIVEDTYSIAKGKGKRARKVPIRHDFDDYVAYALIGTGDPQDYQEAISDPDKEKWMAAMMEEMESLRRNETWKIVRRPADNKVIGYKWFFRWKEAVNSDEQVRYKARLVTKGYAQKKGVDFYEIFSPVVKHTSIRVLLSIVAMHDLE